MPRQYVGETIRRRDRLDDRMDAQEHRRQFMMECVIVYFKAETSPRARAAARRFLGSHRGRRAIAARPVAPLRMRVRFVMEATLLEEACC